MSDNRATELFIRIQQTRHLCWQATIAKRHAAAAAYARELANDAAELAMLLEEKLVDLP